MRTLCTTPVNVPTACFSRAFMKQQEQKRNDNKSDYKHDEKDSRKQHCKIIMCSPNSHSRMDAALMKIAVRMLVHKGYRGVILG